MFGASKFSERLELSIRRDGGTPLEAYFLSHVPWDVGFVKVRVYACVVASIGITQTNVRLLIKDDKFVDENMMVITLTKLPSVGSGSQVVYSNYRWILMFFIQYLSQISHNADICLLYRISCC